MGFEQFGFVSYVSQAKISEFTEHLKNNRLMGTRCKKCGKVYFPPRGDCTSCLGEEIEWVEIKSDGKLVTYTQVNFAPTGFQDDVPYILALGQLNSGQYVFARFAKDVPLEQVKIGMDIQLVPCKIDEERVTYEFQVS
ncbi:MAG: Zn-ribbon domain-containing OB-fold protein [Candidatus Hermodarchaeota archaeon]